MPDSTKTIVLIGSGDRVRRTILPAIHCMGERIKVAAIVGRTPEKLAPLAAEWGWPTTTDLASIDFDTVDLILLSIRKTANPEMLQTLLAHGAGRCTLMIDTPVLEPGQLAAARLFNQFAKVLVAEDTIALPHWRIAGQLVDEGRIGTLKHISLPHSGFRYHALARLRHFSGGGHVRRSSVTRYVNGLGEVRMTFANGITATMTEPHTRVAPRFMVAGSNGVIANFPIVPDSGSLALVLGYQRDDAGRLNGYTLAGEVLPADELDRALFERFPYERVEDGSSWNLDKARGLMTLLTAAFEPDGRFQYPPIEGLYDTLAMKVMRRTTWLDPLAWLGGSILKFYIRLRGSLR